MTVDQLVFQLSAVSGISSGDLSDLRINDGTSDVATGGAAAISAPTGTITFTGNFDVPAGTTKNYTLIGDLANLFTPDTLTISLGTGNITLVSGTVGGSSPTNAAHTTDPPTVAVQISASNDDSYANESADNASGYLTSTVCSGDELHCRQLFKNQRWVPFPGINIPKGSTIDNATVSVYIYSTSYDNPQLRHLRP